MKDSMNTESSSFTLQNITKCSGYIVTVKLSCNWRRQKAGGRITSYPLPLPVFPHKSDGVQQTTYLAQRYCHEATREISKLRPSPEREALIQLTEMVLTRDK